MSIKATFTAVAFGVLAVAGAASLSSSTAFAGPDCSGPPHIVVVEQPNGVTKTLRCVYLPTVSNGRVTGVKGQQEWVTSQRTVPHHHH